MLLLQGPNEMRRALLVVAAATAATQTRTWRTLRLYHINPLRFDADDIADKDLDEHVTLEEMNSARKQFYGTSANSHLVEMAAWDEL